MAAFKRTLMAAVVFAAATGLALAAQPPGGGGKGGGGFGGGGVTGLIKSKTVMADVKITEEQQAKLKDWSKDFQAKSGEMMKAAMEGIDRQDRKAMMEKMPAVQAEISKAAYKELGEVLKPDQVKRLKQIEVQVAGLRAFSQPAVKEALKVTDEQQTKIQDALQVSMRDGRDLNEEYGVQGFAGRPADAEKGKEFDKKRAAITKEAMAKVMSAMTDDQKKTWTTLVGEPIDTAKVQAESAGGGFRGKKKDD